MADQKEIRSDSFASFNDISSDFSELEEENSFIMIDGQKYVRADNNKIPDLEDLEDNDRIRSIPITPRKVHWTAKAALILNNSDASFFGSIFLAFTLFFVLIFAGVSDLRCGLVRYEMGKWNPVDLPWKLISSEATSMTVNKSKVFRHRFSVQISDDKVIESTCHSFHQVKNTESPTVLQSAVNKEIFKLKGTTLNTIPFRGLLLFTGFLSLFMIVSLFLAFGGLPGVFRRILILKNGSVHKAVPIKMEDTGTRINGAAVQKVFYLFLDSEGKRRKTSVRSLNWEKITDEPYEILLCDRNRPERSLILDNLPKGIKMESSRGFTARITTLIPISLLFLFCLLELGILVVSFLSDQSTFDVISLFFK